LRSYDLLKKKKLSTSMFSSMFLILIYLSNMMMTLESQLREMIFDWGIISESDELFDNSSVINKKTVTQCTNIPQKPGIGMQDVVFTFPGQGKQILKGVTFHVNKSDTVVILGDIGSGKSTVLKLLLRFNEPDSGCIYIDGKSYDNMPIKETKKRMGYMYQNPYLFNRSVIENILYGTENVSRNNVVEFMQSIGVDNEFNNLEKGIDTPAGKNGSRLSGGQKQVVLALRIYFQNPDIIILDEPTASLDVKTKKLLKTLLNVILKDKTTIIVTHDEELLELANRQLYVKDGLLYEEGTFKNKKNKSEDKSLPFIMSGGLLN
jgi:ABC-type multidrug transport system fused ATPase/permease subunit